MGLVIEVLNLHKAYGTVKAVDGISFTVEEGEIFGLVGPNGAGKTTTIESLQGLRRPDKGKIRVLSLDPHQDGYALRRRIGVQLQESALPERLRVKEALDLFGAFYSRRVDSLRLLKQMGLVDKAKTPFARLSGGQKQRLFIALALINDPELLFLDELTTGLDPQARRTTWDLVRSIRDQGKTVFLTTHYMEEAERLCSRVAVMDHGRIIALDTPENLVRSLGAETRIIFSIDEAFNEKKLYQVEGVSRVERLAERIIVYGKGEKLVSRVVSRLEEMRLRFRDLRTEQPSLEDVFLTLTGKEMRD